MSEAVLAVPILIFAIPIVAIVMGVLQHILRQWLDYRIKMAEIKSRASLPQGVSPAQFRELHQEVSEMRDRLNQLAIENDRLASLTTGHLQVPPPPPAAALRERING